MVKRGRGGRTALDRLRKWDAKLRGDIIGLSIDAVKDLAREREALYQSDFQYILSTARSIVNKYPEYYNKIHDIVSYMERLWYFSQRYTGDALQVMADATFLFWRARGFDEGLLRECAKALGISISEWSVLLGRLALSQDVVYESVKKALQDVLEELVTIEEAYNVLLDPCAKDVTVIGQTNISRYKFKTLSVKADYGITIKLYCFDAVDEFDPDDPYYKATLAANQSHTVSWEEDFHYCLVLADNPDTTSPHRILYAHLKGRRI